MDKSYVFLSYSHDDQVIADYILDRLTSAGISCWIDHQKIRGGDKYNAKLDAAVTGCSLFIPLLSGSYLEKGYCAWEFDRAIDTKKCIMSVCIDESGEHTVPGKAYMFSWCAGHHIIGYGSGVENSEEAWDKFCDDIINSVPIRYMLRTGENAAPMMQASKYLLEYLRVYNEQQYQQSGNYALNELCTELFPAIIDVDVDCTYADDTKKQVSLITYLSEAQQSKKKNVFLVGEGGMGKTVSMLKTCDYLLEQGKCAVYIPLKNISSEYSFDRYLRQNVCGGRDWIYDHLDRLAGAGPGGQQASVVFLLDGVNELPPGDYIKGLFANEIMSRYIKTGRNIQFIITSRYDALSDYELNDKFTLLSMQPLTSDRVNNYLEMRGLPPLTDQKMVNILRTPLLLNLYANVESHREKYESIEGILLFKAPNTAGKILGNFFQTQLFRAAKEPNFVLADHLVLLEYILPYIAFCMLQKGQHYLSKEEVLNCIYSIEDKDKRFVWYERDRLRPIVMGTKSRLGDVYDLFELALNSLHFLHCIDNKYEFLHQTFRDYFAAYHIVNEMNALLKVPDRMHDIELILDNSKLSDDIISFISDITREENACPVLEETGWAFPGKTDCKPSTKSIAEQLLPLWRGAEGEKAQNAVYNLLNVMSVGRRKNLAWCNLADLDLRACSMNGCKFVEWYCDEIYPSTFERSWINRSFFLSDGHEAPVCALCTDGHNIIFSGDRNGCVKIHDRASRKWMTTLHLYNKPVIDLAWNEAAGTLAILYANILFVYSLSEEKTICSVGNKNRSKTFRYVSFDSNGELILSYNMEPLVWYTIEDQRLSSQLSYDVPAKCARHNPKKNEIVRSNLLQLLSIDVFDEEKGHWIQHPVLTQKKDSINLERYQNEQNPIDYFYIRLRDMGALGKDGISCICYHPSGNRFIIAIDDLLLELDSATLCLLQKKKFCGKVHSVCYGDDCIIAGISSQIFVMSYDMSDLYTMHNTQIEMLSTIKEDFNGDGYYLVGAYGDIKLLDRNLSVKRIRHCPQKPKGLGWVRDRMSGDVQMFFFATQKYPNGFRFSFDTANAKPLGWCYEIIDLHTPKKDKKLYKFDTSVKSISTEPPYNKIEYINYRGIWIFECSFLDIKGNMAEPKNRQILEQNGGKT